MVEKKICPARLRESGDGSKSDHRGLSIARQCELPELAAQQLVLPAGRARRPRTWR